MNIKGILIIAFVTAVVFAVVWALGGVVKKVPSKTSRYINWVVSATAFISGLASFSTGEAVYFNIFLASLVVYFLTISYKTES